MADSEDDNIQTALLDEEDAARYLSASGPLASSPMFEERESQLSLLRRIVQTFNTDAIGVFEAGTGVGKSYAYLIPAMLWAAQNGERVIISTLTINLQHQLFDKDIPAAARIVGKDIKAVLLKGRNNYVCLRRLADAEGTLMAKESDLFGETDASEVEAVMKWAHSPETVTGSRSELPFIPSPAVWQRVRSESDACLAGHCPFRSSCFVSKARKEAGEAQIVVVNHHLLFADAEARLSGISYDDDAVLPAFHRLIIDEAHGIGDAATSFFSNEISRYSLGKAISALYRKQGRREKGYLLRLSSAATEEAAEKIRRAESNARSAIDSLETASLSVLNGTCSTSLACREARGQQAASIRVHNGTKDLLATVLDEAEAAAEAVMSFVSVAKAVLKGATDEEKESDVYWEAKLALTRLTDAAAVLSSFPEYGTAEGKQSVFYLEARGQSRQYVTFCRTPLDPAPKISRGVFEPLSSVVCTSATLSVAGNMEYWAQKSGASLSEGERLITDSFPSPFPYETNCLFAVPSDAPLPNDRGFMQFASAAIKRLITASGGRALVLFTSYESLYTVARAASTAARESDINILCQGEDDNARLLAAFKGDTRAVLFGADSFWQGIDVAGDSLSLVVIVRLPFAVPDDPVFAARAEATEEAGGNPFMQMSVPEAVIKFRQGFGRLIRRSDDRGAVVVLDRRIISSRYGSVFTSSLPKTRKLFAPMDKVVPCVEEMINASGQL